MAPQLLGMAMELAPWRGVNDEVMGGISNSEMVATEDGLRFQGQLSLENNGGFASIRRPFSGDLTGVYATRVRVRGDGRRYHLRLRLRDDAAGVSWRAVVDTDRSWQSLELRLEDFVPVRRGRPVADSGPLVSGIICQLGFLLADGQQGSFGLDIAAIEFLLER